MIALINFVIMSGAKYVKKSMPMIYKIHFLNQRTNKHNQNTICKESEDHYKRFLKNYKFTQMCIFHIISLRLRM